MFEPTAVQVDTAKSLKTHAGWPTQHPPDYGSLDSFTLFLLIIATILMFLPYSLLFSNAIWPFHYSQSIALALISYILMAGF